MAIFRGVRNPGVVHGCQVFISFVGDQIRGHGLELQRTDLTLRATFQLRSYKWSQEVAHRGAGIQRGD